MKCTCCVDVQSLLTHQKVPLFVFYESISTYRTDDSVSLSSLSELARNLAVVTHTQILMYMDFMTSVMENSPFFISQGDALSTTISSSQEFRRSLPLSLSLSSTLNIACMCIYAAPQ